MKSALLAIYFAFGVASPALAASPDCPNLGAGDMASARAQARVTAAITGYDAVDMDGTRATAFEQAQGVPRELQTQHLTLMKNPKTGRAVALLNDGVHCTFGSVFTVDIPNTSPMQAALDFLRNAR